MADRTRPEYDDLRAALRSARQETGISQWELSKRLGVHPAWVQRSESGERRLDVIELVDIAKALGVDVVEILRRAGLTEE